MATENEASDATPTNLAKLNVHLPIRAIVKKPAKKHINLDEEEPLVDSTIVLPLHSKKLDRLNKKQAKKSQQLASQRALVSILRLPAELLLDVLGMLTPTDVFKVQLVNHSLNHLVKEHERTIAKDIVERRYWVLYRCTPLPLLLTDIDPAAYPALLHPQRQKLMGIYKKPYQHIPVIDESIFCTCVTCVLAWNNTCVMLDFAYWQKNLNNREPIPMITAGGMPRWNQELTKRHAVVVERAVASPLTHAAILEVHLRSINGTLLRRSRWSGKPPKVEDRAYHLEEQEAQSGTDQYLERPGPPSYEFPHHRDSYYSLEAYVPNRKWSEKDKCWIYYMYQGRQHEMDLEWAVRNWTPREGI